MNRKPFLMLVGLALLAALAAGGIWLYDWVLGSTLEASQPIRAIPLETQASESQAYPQVQAMPTAPAAQEAYPAPGTVETRGADAKATEEQASSPETQAPAASLFAILQDESEARFTIYEELNGQPITVVGVTDQVAGEASVELADLSQVRLGPIQVNARTLVTDEDRRNQAIRNRILNTDQYEYIIFTPAEIQGLSGGASPGQSFSFSVAGDLTIRDVTQPAVFEVTVFVESAGRLVGSAATTIQRSDFNLIIPSVPFVANVGEEVTLEIDFVMAAANQ
jgi:polyisoprenoid-binding protein YceI